MRLFTKKWSKEEEEILKTNAKKCNITELRKLLPDKTTIAIKSKLGILKISMIPAKTSWTKEEDDIIRNNAAHMKWSEMEKLLPGRNAQTIRVRANYIGIAHSKKWTKEQDEWLKSVYDTMNIDDIVKKVGKRKEAVLVHARSIGLFKGVKHDIWDEEKVTFLVQNYMVMDRNSIAEKIGLTPRQVTKKASILGLKKRK